jgi:hypothetical protein
MTPPRQVWLFDLGCWLALVTAGIHLVGHLLVSGSAVPGSAATPGQRPAYLFLVQGQSVSSTDQVADGLSLSFSLLLATLGSAGLVVGKRGHDDALLLRGVARAYALGTGVLLVVSILTFFSFQTFAIATMAVCFGLATVTET